MKKVFVVAFDVSKLLMILLYAFRINQVKREIS